MDIYRQDVFGVDEFFDFSGQDVFTDEADTKVFHDSTSSTDSGGNYYQYSFNNSSGTTTSTTDFTDHFCVPSEDVAELEWLSNFVNDSSTNFPANNITGTINFPPQNTSFDSFHTSKSRTKRTARSPSYNNSWTSAPPLPISESSSSSDTSSDCNIPIRRCTHCASDKTPQWRTGPLGPKTLCNACGMRYKSGRLVPEYRPAASPTFVLTQHSNSHRKVMELRRQKEMMSGNYQMYGGGYHHHRQPQQRLHHGSNYEVC